MSNNVFKIVRDYWHVIASIITVMAYVIYYGFSVQNQISSVMQSVSTLSSSLNDEHNIMKAYVDSQNKITNIKIDDLSSEMNKMHYEIVDSNERLDNTMSQIMQMQKDNNDQIEKLNDESSQRLDELILMMSSKSVKK